MTYLVRTFHHGRQQPDSEHETIEAAISACESHLGEIKEEMAGSMSWQEDLDGSGWNEVGAWFADDSDMSDAAAIYVKDQDDDFTRGKHDM